MPHEEPTMHEEPVMSHEQPATHERHKWLEHTEAELPRRPRRRLLTPIPLALLSVLLVTCGFIGGVLIEKGQDSPSSASSSGGLASRFAALRSSAAGGSAGVSPRATSEPGGGAFAGTGTTGAGGATIGQVVYVSVHTLYVTNPEGNTVKVRTSAASTVTKTVKTDVNGIHPGETVIVTGNVGANGAISAESIRVSEAGGGGLQALFGAGGGLRGQRREGGPTGRGGGNGAARDSEGPVLFGK